MQQTTRSTSLNPTVILGGLALDPSRTLFLDIETTGLSPKRDRVCLIGCAFFDSPAGTWQIRQWFDDTGSCEREMLLSFSELTEHFDHVIHFNGRTFDLPFLEKRAAADGVPLSFSAYDSIDLYRILLSRKNILGLPNYKQQTVEDIMGTGRREHTSGRDFVNGYRQFLRTHSEGTKAGILAHNFADMEGLLSLAPLLTLRDLDSEQFSVVRAVADSAEDAGGSVRDYLTLSCTLSSPLPLPVRAHAGSCFMKAQGNRCFFSVPMVTCEMKMFFQNFRDYYYLPQEDRAIHRSIARFVEKSHRVPAKADTCYERVRGTFLPCPGSRPVTFRKEYRDKERYLLFDDKMKCSREAMNAYAKEMFLYLITV